MQRKSKLNAVQSLANQFTDGELKPLADMINKTFQRISNYLGKLSPAHQQTTAVIPAEYVIPLIDAHGHPSYESQGPNYIPHWVFREVSSHSAAWSPMFHI